MSVDAFGEPVVATHGAADPSAPLVVLLHGRGSNEQEILSMAPHLPAGATYAAVRAPIAEGGGFAWFANHGIGRPVAASLEATMHSVDLTQNSWLVSPDSALRVGELESRIIVDSTHVGRFMGIKDLLVEAPPKETNDATGGTTESGISGSEGLVFTGTPTAAGFDERVSVSVDVSTPENDETTLVFTATDVLTGPGTADQQVPDDKKAAVLAAFNARMPGMKLPFGIKPTSEGARGSDVIVEGIGMGVIVSLDGFRQR